MFNAAGRLGRSADLDWMCAGVAAEQFVAADLPGCALFINLDPYTLRGAFRERLSELLEDLMGKREVVIEVTERAMTQDPAALMEAVVHIRRLSGRVALDDVGVDPSSLAAMPLINADIIKVDRGVVQAHSSTWAVSHVVNAVLDDAGHSGAQILAEGIEGEEHLEVARSLGATLAQGYLFGRPAPLPEKVEHSTARLARVESRQVPVETPFEMLSLAKPVNPTTDTLLTAMVVNLAEVNNFNDDAQLRYGYITTRGVEVYVLGHGIPTEPGNRIRGVPLDAGDPLVDEREALFIGSHYASGVFARETDSGFDAGVCYERDRIVEVALPLVRRLKR